MGSAWPRRDASRLWLQRQKRLAYAIWRSVARGSLPPPSTSSGRGRGSTLAVGRQRPYGCRPLADMTSNPNPEDSPAELRLRARPIARPFSSRARRTRDPAEYRQRRASVRATRCPLPWWASGFRIDEHAVRRAGLDYWHLVDVRTHETLDAAESAIDAERAFGRAPRRFLFSGHAERSYLDVQFELGDVLIFGKESVGLPETLLRERRAEVVGIPMSGLVRSHNLANSVAIALYEALRQTGVLATTSRGA